MTQPHMFILSYLPTSVTPTRVRKMALIGIYAAAAIYGIVALVLGYATITRAIRVATRLTYYTPYGTSTGAPSTALEVWREIPTGVALLLLALLTAAILLILAAMFLRRYRKSTTLIVIVLLLPLFLSFCTVAAFCLSLIPLANRDEHLTTAVVCIPIFLITTLLALLTIDILSCIRWLRRHPDEEMPPKTFLENGSALPASTPQTMPQSVVPSAMMTVPTQPPESEIHA